MFVNLEKLCGPNASTGATIFHEIAEAGAINMLHRFHYVMGQSCMPFMRVPDYAGNFCTHVVMKYFKGIEAINIFLSLVTLGADLNMPNTLTGLTILHIAVINDDHVLVTWLIQQPQIIITKAKSYGDMTPFDVAILKGDKTMFNILRSSQLCQNDLNNHPSTSGSTQK